MKKMYVVREYYKDEPSTDKYYFKTRKECEKWVAHLQAENDDIDEITISDEPEDVDLFNDAYVYVVRVHWLNKPFPSVYYSRSRETCEDLKQYMWEYNGKPDPYSVDDGDLIEIDAITISEEPEDLYKLQESGELDMYVFSDLDLFLDRFGNFDGIL